MNRAGAFFLGVIAVFATMGPAAAHEIRPAYLEIRDTGETINILWKQPVAGNRTIAIRPHLSAGWLEPEAARSRTTGSALIREWTITPPHAPLTGQTLTIEGLDATITDVLLRITWPDGTQTVRMIHPDDPTTEIAGAAGGGTAIGQYLWLGMTHIWGGIDHLLYVFGLVLLVMYLKPLLATLTAFTAAHSITLAATTLGLVQVPQAPVEAFIALSIVYLAVELVGRERGETGWAGRHPWLVAFPFGLLHGFGFAGALRDIGLPAGDIPSALLFFNLGIEAGQVAFVLAVLAIAWLLGRAGPLWLPALQRASPYVIGSLASYWVIGRTIQVM